MDAVDLLVRVKSIFIVLYNTDSGLLDFVAAVRLPSSFHISERFSSYYCNYHGLNTANLHLGLTRMALINQQLSPMVRLPTLMDYCDDCQKS